MENQIENLSFTSFLVDRPKLLITRILQAFFMFWIMMALAFGCGLGAGRSKSSSDIMGRGIMEKTHRDKASIVLLFLMAGLSAYGLYFNTKQKPKKGEITLNENEIILKIKHKETRFPIQDLENIEFKIATGFITNTPNLKENENISYESSIGNYLKIKYLAKEIKGEFVINNQKLYKEIQAIIQVWRENNIPVKVI